MLWSPRRWTVLSAALAVAFAVSSCISTPPARLRDITGHTVQVHVLVGPYSQGGTGVVLHSSAERGTFVLTNFHVIRAYSDGSQVPTLVQVSLSGGAPFPMDVVAVEDARAQIGGKTEISDLALLWAQPGAPVLPSVTGIERKMRATDAPTWIAAFCPKDVPYVIQTAPSESERFRDCLSASEPITPGNSGSGVYDHEGDLVGVIWGRDPDSDHGLAYFVPAGRIARFLIDSGVGWIVIERPPR